MKNPSMLGGVEYVLQHVGFNKQENLKVRLTTIEAELAALRAQRSANALAFIEVQRQLDKLEAQVARLSETLNEALREFIRNRG